MRINTVLSAAVALAIALVLREAGRREKAEIRRTRELDAVIREVFDLNALNGEFFANPHERVEQQWWATHRRVGDNLAVFEPGDGNERALVDRITREHQRAGALFRTLSRDLEHLEESLGEPESEALLRQVSGQINVGLRAIAAQSDRLFDSIYTRLLLRGRQSSRLAIVFGCLVAVVVLASAILVSRKLVLPLDRLQAGMQVIGEGDLDHKVDTRARDEIGDLARGFDRMTKRLKETTASREALEREVAFRRKAEEKLQRLAEELSRSNRELEQFARAASHDLQEPLRKVEAFGNLLLTKCGDALPQIGREYVERMQNASTRMQGLINGLLSYSRVTTRAQAFSAVDLGRTVDGVVADLEVAIRDAEGRIDVDDLPVIEAEPVQMRQLFQNLIGNALKFHRPDEPAHVRITCADVPGEDSTDTGGRTCRIVVGDNGIGLDEKYADRIFGVFQRLHGRGKYPGTGIGLAVCRKIAERHGGSITVTSKPGEGAHFAVTLPMHQNGKQGVEEDVTI